MLLRGSVLSFMHIDISQIEEELLMNQLMPREYVFLFRFLLENQEHELSEKVIKTAAFIYPSNAQIARTMKSHGVALPSKPIEKVFGIGLSRTGTNSLSHALMRYGLHGYHWTGSNGKNIFDWEEIESSDFLADTPVAFIFETLFYAYPDACFIYTARDKGKWVQSMENHFKWADGFKNFKEIVFRNEHRESEIINDPLWGVIHRNLYANSSSWEEAYEKFEERVYTFFSEAASSSKFLRMDVEWPDEKKWKSLSKLLCYNFIPLAPFPRKNVKLNLFTADRTLIDSIILPYEEQFQLDRIGRKKNGVLTKLLPFFK